MSGAFKKIKERATLNNKKNAFINEWIKTMTYAHCFNSMLDTFQIVDLEPKNYGWNFRLLCPYGLTLDMLEKLTPYIEYNIGCHFQYNIHVSNKFAACDIIYEELIKCNEIEFQPYKVKPWQLYLGVRVTGKPILCDVNTYPFCLIAGQTRRGKNGSLNHILISLINSCSKDEFRLLYYQGAKGDGRIYKKCEQTYAWASNNFTALYEMCKYCKQQMDYRTKLFEPMYDSFKGDNILAYNKLNKNNILPYIYLVIDEFLVVCPDPSDSKEVKELKNQIIDCLKQIAQFGGALGVTYIICHQKPQKELCPTFLKNMSNCRVCFGFEDEVCSRIVLESDKAKGLPARRAYVLMGGQSTLIFTTNLEDKMEQYLKPHYNPARRDLFKDLSKLNRVNEPYKKIKQDDKEEISNSGKEFIKNEQLFKQKDEEIAQKEAIIAQKQSIIQQQQEQIQRLEEQYKQLKYKQMKKGHDIKYNYDMVTPSNNIEDNIKKIPNFVPYQNTGKEIIKK